MVRVGKYDLPKIDIDDAVERLRKARNVIPGRSAKRGVFAEAMDLKDVGGQTHHVLSAMVMYGLIETGSGDVHITDLGEQALFGEANEINLAKAKAINHVELFGEIYKTYDVKPTDEQLRAFLKQKAVITDLQQIPILLRQIGKLLNKHLPYTSYAEGAGAEGAGQAIGGGEGTTETKVTGIVEIRPEEGKPYIFPLDDIDLARSLINAVLDGMKRKKELTLAEKVPLTQG